MRRLILTISLALTLGACQQPTDAETQLHASTMQRYTSYKQIERKKVMAACINWENSDSNRLDISGTYTYYVGIGSDIDIFTPKLMQSALNWCNQDRSKKNLKCVCEPLDKNGKSALRVPENVASGRVAVSDRGYKLTVSELQSLIAPGVSLSGTYKKDTRFTIRHLSNGRASVTWESDTEMGSDTGRWRILGDASCKKWDSLFDGVERCWLIYKTGENEYRSYRDDVPVATWSVVE